MKPENTLRRLKELGATDAREGDVESMHAEADALLADLVRQYVPFPVGAEIVKAWDSVPKWYA